MCYNSGAMERLERVVHWIRKNAGLLALIVAVPTFVGGIAAAGGYFSKLATKNDVTVAVSEATEPLHEAAGSLQGTVANLRATVGRLEGTVGGIDTSVRTLSSTVTTLSGMLNNLDSTVRRLNNSVNTLNATLPLLVSCVIELHGPWTDGGGVDARPYRSGGLDDPRRGERLELPRICDQARELVDPQAASGR